MMRYDKVAVLRMDALGDTLLSLPALDSLVKAWPRCRLHLFCSAVGAPAMEHLGQVCVVPKNWSAAQLASAIRDRRPDALLVFTEKRRAYLGAYLSGTPIRVGFDPGWTQPVKSIWLRLALTHRLSYPNDLDVDPGLHEVERYQRLVGLLGLEEGPPPPIRFPLDEVSLEQARSWTADRFDRAPLGLQLGPKWELDGWPAEWVQTLSRQLPAPTVAFVGPGEEAWASRVLTDTPLVEGRFTDLRSYAAVLSRCRLLITPDTGAAHLAAAVGVPVVDVFREQHHQHCVRRWRPWAVDHRVVLKGPYSPDAGAVLAEQILLAAKELA